MSGSGTRRTFLLIATALAATGAMTDSATATAGVVVLLFAAVTAGAALLRQDRPLPAALAPVPEGLTWVILAAGVTAFSSELGRKAMPMAVAVPAGVVLFGLLVLSVRAGRTGRLATGATVVVAAGGYVLLLHAAASLIDVQVFLEDGARRLFAGHNPWDMTFPNVYSPETSARVYAPGVVVGNRLDFGFPYPPPILLGVLPGALLGDTRLAQLAMLVVTAVLLHRFARDRVGRLAAFLPLLTPAAPRMIERAWTEPLVILLLAATTLALAHRHRGAPYLLGVLLVAKQYMVVVLPLLWLVPAARRRGFLVRTALAGAVVTLPFFLWDPGAFWHSVVSLQFVQPYRPDSTSLLVWSVGTFGWPPPAVYGVLPFAVSLIVAGVLARWAPRTPWAFAASTGLVLLALVLCSKQAFLNYYFLVTAAFVVAVVLAPLRDALAQDERDDDGRGDAEDGLQQPVVQQGSDR